MASNKRKMKFAMREIPFLYLEFQDNRKFKKFTDVKVKVGNVEIDAHRMILEKASPVIKTMLQPQWFDGKVLEFNEENVDSEILEDLLNVFYMIPIEITAQNAFSLCIASHYLNIPNLLRKCEKFLLPEISLENVLDLYNLSKNFELKNLNLRILKFLDCEYKNIPENHKIYSLNFDQIKEIFEDMIDKNKKKLFSKENTFNFIVSWAEYDTQFREAFLPNLFQQFSLKELSDAFLTEHIFASNLVNKFSSCSKDFEEVSKEIQSVSQTFGSSRLYLLGGECLPSISYMNLMNGKRRIAFQTPELKCLYGTAVIDQKIYFFDHRGYLKVFDCEDYTCTTLTRIKGGWKCMGMTTLNGLLYVSGGQNGLCGDDFLYWKKFLQYSPQTNKWTELKDMNEGRYNHTMIALNGLIYAIGGKKTRTIECYNPSTNEWNYIEMPGTGFAYSSVALHHNKIYIFAYHEFKVFDPEFNTWQELTYPSNMFNGTLVSINDKLLLVGNNSNNPGNFPSKNVLEFNTADDSWSEILNLDYEPYFDYAVAVNFSKL